MNQAEQEQSLQTIDVWRSKEQDAKFGRDRSQACHQRLAGAEVDVNAQRVEQIFCLRSL
jgi:hypothetical protein